jgi:hypothetical protein
VLHIGFSRQLAKINFKDRATVRDGRVAYRLADGSGHVSLDAAEWRAMNAVFDEESGKVLRKAKRWLIGLLPGIFVYGMTLGQVLPFGGIVILSGFFLGPPAIYFWQSSRINRIALRMDEELAGRPKVAAPPRPRWRVPRGLEIACAVLVGPHLIFEIVGSFYPEAYRNTPLLGTQLNWTSLISFSVLAAILYLRWRSAQEPAQPRARGRSGAPERPATSDMPAPRTFGRRVDPLVRARDTSS